MKLALGTVQFGLDYGIANSGGRISHEDAIRILEIARFQGIDTLDTAISYGDSEARLGELGVKEFKVITKLPEVPRNIGNVKEWVRKQIKESIERLQISHLEGLLLHRSWQFTSSVGKELEQVLLELKVEGFIRKIGVSIYHPQELADIFGHIPIDLVQTPYNLLDRRIVSSGWLTRLREANVEVHARSVFLQGLLLLERNSLPDYFQQWPKVWAEWYDWLGQDAHSALSGCLAAVVREPGIQKMVVGVDSAIHLEQLVNVYKNSNNASSPSLQTDIEELIDPTKWNIDK